MLEYKKIVLDLHLFDTITVTGDSGMTAEMKTFYSKDLIRLASPKLVHGQFAKMYTIPPNSGKIIEMRRVGILPKATTALNEGTAPLGNSVDVTAITATIDQYGDYIRFSDMVDLVAIDPMLEEFTAALANQAGRTKDTLTREELAGGSTRIFAPIVSGETTTPVLLRSSITTNALLTPAMLREMVAYLKRVDAPTINGKYPIIIHTDVAMDLQADTEWKEAHKYTDSEAIWNGYIGSFAGAIVHESTEAKIIGPDWIFGDADNDGVCRLTLYTALTGGGSVDIYPYETISTAQAAELTAKIAAGTAPQIYVGGNLRTLASVTAGAVTVGKLTVTEAVDDVAQGGMICGASAGSNGSAVYCSIMVGEGAYGETKLEGAGLEFIVKPVTSGGADNPLNQRGSAGWKMAHVAKRLVEQYIVRCEHSASYGLSAVSN